MLYYATFWQRFFAALLDGLLFVLADHALVWLSRSEGFALAHLTGVLFVVYAVCGHAKFGKTIGKHLMGIRVVSVSAQPVGWRKAWLRSSVDLGFALITVAGTLLVLAGHPPRQIAAGNETWVLMEPAWIVWVEAASILWFFSECFVMLTNPARRAVHDFIAGTVVVMGPR